MVLLRASEWGSSYSWTSTKSGQLATSLEKELVVGQDEPGANDIDKLPDSLLISIINLLAIKDAVRTSTLSRRWRHLWKWIPSIDFGFDLQLQNKTYSSRDEHFYEQSRRLATIAKHVFSSHLGTISCCRIMHYLHNCQSIAQWLKHLSKRGIHKLVLACRDRSGGPEDTWVHVHSTIVHCSSLRVLELRSWKLVDATPLMGYCNLRTLTLISVHLTEEAIIGIISKCVALEWLALLRCNIFYSVKIHAPTLKGLKLKFLNHLENIEIDAPCLMTLTMSYLSVRKFIKLEVPNVQILHTYHVSEERINMGTTIKSKRETCNANMDFLSRCVGLYGVSSRNLFENLQKLCINVELTNVSHVIALCYVLRHCVHIRALQLEIEQYPAWDKSERSSNLSCPEFDCCSRWDAIDYFYDDLETVTVNGFLGEHLELNFVNHLIIKAPKLQRMTIRCNKYCSEAHELARRRASSNLNIVIEPTRK